MKNYITFLVFAFVLSFAISLSAQAPAKDVVYLKNGKIVKDVEKIMKEKIRETQESITI